MGQTTDFQGTLSTLGSVHPTSNKMNGKYALALILALQVSMSLCEIAAPDQELVDKYEAMKATFFKRLLNAYNKVHTAAGPVMEKVARTPMAGPPRTTLRRCRQTPMWRAPSRLSKVSL